MKVLGHHVALPAILLACVDAALFLATLYAFGFAGSCTSCYFHSVTHLRLHEAILLTIAFVAITASIGVYNRDSLLSFRGFLNRFLLASQFVFIPAIVVVGIGKAVAGLPFGWFVGVLSMIIGVFFAILFTLRVLLLWAYDFSFLKRRILVIGDTAEADEVTKFVAERGKAHLRCVGRISSVWKPREVVSDGNLLLQTEPTPGHMPLAEVTKSLRVEEIVVAVNDKRGLPMWQLLDCKLQGTVVTDYLAFWERETGRLDLRRVGPGWLALNEGFRLDWTRRFIKRLVDIVVSVILLTITLPITLLVALAIKLDSPGPVLYKQQRVGQDGKPFWIWKFRSMTVNSEASGAVWAKENDKRITRVGSIIRKLRIDEVPQVVNVLRGEMSFIGPRPEQVQIANELSKSIALYDLRHRVQPGITGWAQVNYRYGASVEDAETKLSYDLYYVKNQDLILDFVILLQTVRVIMFAHGSR
ncbi:MAG: TIGR03013 family XrtA/PEP-CTERM system glycosyltransferase [Alphaproteobacteria bacterium]